MPQPAVAIVHVDRHAGSVQLQDAGRHRGDQLALMLHLHAHGPLGRTAFGDVENGRDVSQRAAVGIAVNTAAHDDRSDLAVGTQQPQFLLVGLAGAQGVLHRRDDGTPSSAWNIAGDTSAIAVSGGSPAIFRSSRLTKHSRPLRSRRTIPIGTDIASPR